MPRVVAIVAKPKSSGIKTAHENPSVAMSNTVARITAII